MSRKSSFYRMLFWNLLNVVRTRLHNRQMRLVLTIFQFLLPIEKNLHMDCATGRGSLVKMKKLYQYVLKIFVQQVPSIEAILESLAVAFTSEETKKDGPVGDVPYNSKVEGGSITFDFNSSKSEATSNINEGVEHIPSKAHETDTEKVNVPSVAAPVQLASSEEKLKEHGCASDSDSNFVKQGAAANNENGNLDNLSVSNRIPRGEGETSFSASAPLSGLITYSGPIAYSGSISLRSDSSTTSTRSFAFPV